MANERVKVILDVEAEVSKARGSIQNLTKVFDDIGGSKGNQLRELLSQIGAEYDKIGEQSGRAMSKVGDFSKAEKSSDRLNSLLKKLGREFDNIGKLSSKELEKLFPAEVANRIAKTSDAIKTYNTILENSNKKKGAIGAAADEYKKQEQAARKAAEVLKDLRDVQNGNSKKQVVTSDVKAKKQESLITANTDVKKYSAELEAAQKAMDEFKVRKADLFTKGTQNKSSEFRTLRDDLAAAENNFKTATDKAGELKRELKNMVVVGDLDAQIKDAEAALKEAQDAAEKLKGNLDNVTASEFSRAFDEAKKKLEGISGIDLNEIGNIDDLNNLLQRFTTEGVDGLKKGLQEAGIQIKELGTANEQVSSKISNATSEVERQNTALENINGIKSRIQYFFSLANTAMLARRALQQTFETVKELDAAMTETAVVTDFSVGDMWEQLPRYTKAANDLGTTTLGAYETMTLFYQQGLETNEVFEIGTETMKMARIAGLEYKDATDLMTAALRGFNMELNEASATRINDVYSELAAITAADTNEIATAMTKTASIAANANMEFETTAALLSQIIETTREPAETAGTAMKTIIARFTEMKKATSDVINVDGEEVNVNKVEAALKTAGVALRDFNGEFRDLDDVFLELSSKWNSLDKMTQRYIATMAAGSRQQSRFIAMMQDYDRTIELVDAAYDSSGASQRQFEKTQESLESKINKLKNAWNEFLMGISNSTVIKAGIDALTQILNLVNKLTGAFGEGAGGALKLGVAIAGLAVGAKASDAVFRKIAAYTQNIKQVNEGPELEYGYTGKFQGIKKTFTERQQNNILKETIKQTGIKGRLEGKSEKEIIDLQKKAVVNKKIEMGVKLDDEEYKLFEAELKAKKEALEKAMKIDFKPKDLNVSSDMNSNDFKKARGTNAKQVRSTEIRKQIDEIRPQLEAYEKSLEAYSKIDFKADLNEEDLAKIKAYVEAYEQLLEESTKIDMNVGLDEEDLAKVKAQMEAYEKALEATTKVNVGVEADPKSGRLLATSIGEKIKTALLKVAGMVGSSSAAVGAAIAGGILAAIAAAVGVGLAAYFTNPAQVAKREAEDAEAAVNRLKEGCEALETTINDVTTAWEQLNNSNLDSLVEGTLAWRQALLENNQIILDLIEKYPELKDVMEVGEGGRLTLNQEKYEEFINEKIFEQTFAQIGQQNQKRIESYKKGIQALEEEYKNELLTGRIISGNYVSEEFKYGFSNIYEGKNNSEEIDWETYSDKEILLKYEQYSNRRQQLENQFLQETVEGVSSYLPKNVSNATKGAAKKIAENILKDSSLYDLENQTFDEKKISKSWGGSKSDIKEATEEDIKALSDSQLAMIGFRWTDENKTALETLSGANKATYQVTKGGWVDSDKDVEDEEAKTEGDKNNNIDAGYLLSKVAETWNAESILKNSAILAQALPETANEIMAGGFATADEITSAAKLMGSFTKEAETRISEIDRDLKEATSEEDKRKLREEKKQLEDSRNAFNTIFGQNIETTLNNQLESNLKSLNASLSSLAIDTQFVSKDYNVETANNYKQVLDNIQGLDIYNQVQAARIFDEQYNWETSDDSDEQQKQQQLNNELANFASKLNTESAILGMKQLQKGLNSTNPQIKVFSEEMIQASNVSDSFYSAQNQVKEILTSDEYAEYAEDLSKLAKEGKLTAESIYEIANSNELLSTALDNGTVKAGALAEIFRQVQEEGKGLGDFTQDLIEYYNELTASATSSGRALNFIKNFKPSESQVTAAEGWKEQAEALQQYANANAYNDQYFTDLLKIFASESQWEIWEKDGKTNKERYQELKAIIGKQAGGTAYDVLSMDAASTKEGNAVYWNNGQLNFNLSEYQSVESLITGIAEQYKISKEYANQLIADTRIYNTELDSALKGLDKRNAFIQDLVNFGRDSEAGVTEPLTMKISDEWAKQRGYDNAQAYIEEFNKVIGTEKVKFSYTTEVEPRLSEEEAKKELKSFVEEVVKETEIDIQDQVYKIAAKVQILAEASGMSVQGLRDNFGKSLMDAGIITNDSRSLHAGDKLTLTQKAIDAGLTEEDIEAAAQALSDSLTAAQNVAHAEQMVNIAEQGKAVYEAYHDAIISALSNVQVPLSWIGPFGGEGLPLGRIVTGEITSSPNTSDYQAKIDEAKADLASARQEQIDNEEAYDKVMKAIGANIDDTTADPYTAPGDGSGSSSNKEEKTPYDVENADAQLEALERLREVNEREAELISKLPEQIRPFFEMANLAEKMGYEYQEIQINKNKLEFLEQEEQAARDELKAKGYLDKYMYYDEQLDEMMWNVSAMEGVSGSERDKITEAKEKYDSANDERQAIEKELDGGKIQAFVKALSKGAKDISQVLKTQGKETKDVDNALRKLEKQLGLTERSLQPLSDKFKEIVSNSKYLNSEFEGLSDTGDKMVDAFKAGPLGQFMTDETAEQLKNGGVTKGQMGGSILGDIGNALGFSGDLLNFDMMGMGLDMFNMGQGLMEQGKQMAEQVIGYITQATQVLVDAWTNREDYLYNFLQIIEKYLHDYEKMQRYSTQLEQGRMATVDDIRASWEQQWQSLQEQLEMQRDRQETRQQQLELSTWSPFAIISGWDPTTDSLYENREIKALWDILIGAIGMLPMGLGAFGEQLNQLYEDHDKRVQEAYQDRLEAEMAILDIEDERLELVKVGSEEATEFEQKVLDALIQKEQEQIDELSRLNDAITDANSKLISTLQSNLEQIRQDRENEKKEEELSEKQRRLSYLRQDTSGANAVEIKKLEEQLEEEHEDYTDTLIDQKISELEEQNELAAEQRQQQIDLLQAQLDWSEKYGLYWDAIYGMLYTIDENGNAVLNPENFDSDGNIRENSQLAKMLQTFSDQIGMSTWSQILEMDELKKLGRYYGAFIGNNGVDGNWADYWALLDPGANDPDYYDEVVKPEGFWGVLWELENSLNRYFIRSDSGLANAFGRIEQFFKNGIGKLFGIDEWAEYEFTGAYSHKINAPVTEGAMDFFDNLSKLFEKGWRDFLSLFNRTTYGNETTNRTQSNRKVDNGVQAQSSGVRVENINLSIETQASDAYEVARIAIDEINKEFGGTSSLGSSRY